MNSEILDLSAKEKTNCSINVDNLTTEGNTGLESQVKT